MCSKKVLFVFQNTSISYNLSGASTRRMMDFKALLDHGYEVHVIRIVEPHFNIEIKGSYEYQELQHILSKCASWKDINFEVKLKGGRSLLNLFQLFNNPILYRHENIKELSFKINKELIEKNIDLIWTSSNLSTFAVSLIKPKASWVNYIGDWRHRLRIVRLSDNSTRLRLQKQWFFSYLDLKMDLYSLRRCDFVETSSTLQAAELRNYGLKNVVVIQQFYEGTKREISRYKNDKPKIIHLGSLETTSNRVGLLEYFENIHGSLKAEIPNYKLYIIGDAYTSSDALKEFLCDSAVECVGKINDLTTFVEPGDIGIIPYRYNTGMRTKIALFHSLCVPVISFKQPVIGMPEVEHGKNAELVESWEEFQDAIKKIMVQARLRERYALEGLKTFNEFNSYEAQKVNYQKIFKEISRYVPT